MPEPPDASQPQAASTIVQNSPEVPDTTHDVSQQGSRQGRTSEGQSFRTSLGAAPWHSAQ